MARQPESNFSSRFAKALEKIPGVWFVKVQQVAKCGTPDYLICAGGVFIAAELKRNSAEKPSPLQQYNLEAITACGGTARVVTPKTLNSFLTEVREYAEHYFEVSRVIRMDKEN